MSPHLPARATTIGTFMPARRASSAHVGRTAGSKYSREAFCSALLAKRSFGGLQCGFT